MKKIYLILFTVFLSIGMFSCTPQSNSDDKNQEQLLKTDCCDEDEAPIVP